MEAIPSKPQLARILLNIPLLTASWAVTGSSVLPRDIVQDVGPKSSPKG